LVGHFSFKVSSEQNMQNGLQLNQKFFAELREITAGIVGMIMFAFGVVVY